MVDLGSYTPTEAFFIVRAITKYSSLDFRRLSNHLSNDEHLLSDPACDLKRLAPEALKDFFFQTLRQEFPALPPFKWAVIDDYLQKIPTVYERLGERYKEDALRQLREWDAIEAEFEREEAEELKARQTVPEGKLAIEEQAAAAAQGHTPRTFPPALVPKPDARLSARPSPSPLAAPVPEVIKRAPTPIYPPQPPRRDLLPATKPSGTPSTGPSHQPLQVPVVAKPVEQAKVPNGASQVLQPPQGVPQVVPLRASPPQQPASTGTVTSRPELAPKKSPVPPPHSLVSSPGTLKWEKPYQPPQQIPSQRPLQPNLSPGPTAYPGTPPPTHAPQRFPPKYPASTNVQGVPPPPSQPLLHTPHGVLAPPQQQLGQLAYPLPPPQGKSPSDISPPTIVQSKPTPVPLPGSDIQTAHAQVSQQTSQRQLPATSPGRPVATPGPYVATPQHRPQNSQAPPQPPLSAIRAPTPPQPYISPYTNQSPRSNLTEPLGLPNLSRLHQATNLPSAPQTPVATTPTYIKRGYGTKWTISTTPSTPGPTGTELGSPAFEPLSPVLKPTVGSAPQTASRKSTPKSIQKLDGSVGRPGRGRPPRSGQRSRGGPLASLVSRRSQSVASQADELSLDHNDLLPKVKDEESTPRLLREETGDTTADESVASRKTMATSGLTPRPTNKRKRQDSVDMLPIPAVPPVHVRWTRGFQRMSASALDQIGGHRDANMFANPVRERDAPNYSGIILQPQDIASIKKAITHGNRIAAQVAASLPDGDPGTPSVDLPVSDDLAPPRAIINSAQLERELLHMFLNAIMYNPDPVRGPGPAFRRRRPASATEDASDALGYEVDEYGVVKTARNMSKEVQKLLEPLRAAETPRVGGAPLPASITGTTRPGSVATAADDDTADEVDELAAEDVSGSAKRTRTRG